MQYMSIPEVAERLDVSKATVAGWILSGELKAANVSESKTSKKPRWRIRPEDLDTFLASRSTTPATTPAPTTRRPRKRAMPVEHFYR